MIFHQGAIFQLSFPPDSSQNWHLDYLGHMSKQQCGLCCLQNPETKFCKVASYRNLSQGMEEDLFQQAQTTGSIIFHQRRMSVGSSWSYPLSSSLCLRVHPGCLLLPDHQIQLLHCYTQSSWSHVGDNKDLSRLYCCAER